jgi:hypothetical protein
MTRSTTVDVFAWPTPSDVEEEQRASQKNSCEESIRSTAESTASEVEGDSPQSPYSKRSRFGPVELSPVKPDIISNVIVGQTTMSRLGLVIDPVSKPPKLFMATCSLV